MLRRRVRSPKVEQTPAERASSAMLWVGLAGMAMGALAGSQRSGLYFPDHPTLEAVLLIGGLAGVLLVIVSLAWSTRLFSRRMEREQGQQVPDQDPGNGTQGVGGSSG